MVRVRRGVKRVIAVVIPARNEAASIETLLGQVLRTSVGLIIPVLNGCEDMTAELIRRITDKRIRPISFREPLGYDVPRIAGAQAALEEGADLVLFVDADLTGPVAGTLMQLADGVRRKGFDLALTDCYTDTPIPYRQSAARDVYQARRQLNQRLGREDLGAAIPSHGPAAVTARLLKAVPLASVGVPPLMQTYALLAGLKGGVAAQIPHKRLGSAAREKEHRLKIAQTIIGDCHQGCSLVEGRPFDRQGFVGYHAQRRFDLVGLEEPQPAALSEAFSEAT
jgi:hypothetical protein